MNIYAPLQRAELMGAMIGCQRRKARSVYKSANIRQYSYCIQNMVSGGTLYMKVLRKIICVCAVVSLVLLPISPVV